MATGLTTKHDRLQMAMLADIAGTCVLHRSPGSELELDLCVGMEAAIPKGLGRLSNAGDRRRQCPGDAFTLSTSLGQTFHLMKIGDPKHAI